MAGNAQALVARLIEGNIDAFLDFLHPDVVFVEDPRFPEGGTFRGREAVVRYVRDWLSHFAHYDVRLDELHAEGDRILARAVETARGKDSGAGVDQRINWVFVLREGSIVRWEAYFDDEAARAAFRAGP